MRYMILIKATADSEAGVMPTADAISEMVDYHEELAKAGALVNANGLMATSHGWRQKYEGGKRVVTDGPFAESKELIAGYTIIEVATPDEALDWFKRFPNPYYGADGEIEMRRVFDLDDLGDSEGVERFRKLDAQGKSGS
ncbi:dehydrogenase [Hyphomicrobium nitrativorans NL23]|uniref:Dehydrogenase n=1 Tax=Hyphomicrobium nitrativorans NL23 TaxID=1029756 RepID=V5S929_9HYPH|nr:YciI family protein [Hyphomicrobium nitrativorans]AHB47266.1 dehydrogenase [Hyphomicrobium nitrativorans NL23]